jgi:hypothetical protein
MSTVWSPPARTRFGTDDVEIAHDLIARMYANNTLQASGGNGSLKLKMSGVGATDLRVDRLRHDVACSKALGPVGYLRFEDVRPVSAHAPALRGDPRRRPTTQHTGLDLGRGRGLRRTLRREPDELSATGRARTGAPDSHVADPAVGVTRSPRSPGAGLRQARPLRHLPPMLRRPSQPQAPPMTHRCAEDR